MLFIKISKVSVCENKKPCRFMQLLSITIYHRFLGTTTLLLLHRKCIDYVTVSDKMDNYLTITSSHMIKPPKVEALAFTLM